MFSHLVDKNVSIIFFYSKSGTAVFSKAKQESKPGTYLKIPVTQGAKFHT
jgi:hypothetical protein